MAFNQFPSKGGIPSGNTASRPGSPVIGDTYYNGTLELLEIYNGTAWVASSAPPATPTIASVTDVGTFAYTSGGALDAVFTPGVGGSTATQYNAFTTSGGFTGSSSSTTVRVSGLTPATSFTIYGNAQNNFGTTTNSANAAAVTVTTRPQAPTIGTASTNAGTSTITVTWTLGATGGKNLSAITITPYLNGTTAETSQNAATTSSTSHSFTGLTMGSSYTFKVFAVNANGNGAESAATNSVTIPALVSLDVLVVAGGAGGGGTIYGGGGGAGGYVYSTGYGVSKSTNFAITVGGGGNSPGNSRGGDGSDSSFSTIYVATGGGGGGSWNQNRDGRNGGSGGGGSENSGFGSPGTATQASYGGLGFGNNGGTQNASAESGGGGGAGGLGRPSEGVTGSTGGIGKANSITGTSTYYAGGGGGGNRNNSARSGGLGGGGYGGQQPGGTTTPGNGDANTGGGGGGRTNEDGQGAGLGGSGVVIFRYLTSSGTISIGAGLTGSTVPNGSYSVSTITAGSGNVSWS